MSISGEVGNTNPFSFPGGAKSAASPAGASAVPSNGDFLRLLVTDDPSQSGPSVRDGENVFLASQLPDPQFLRGLFEGEGALQRDGELGRPQPISGALGFSLKGETPGGESSEFFLGAGAEASEAAGDLATLAASEPEGEEIAETEESADTIAQLAVAVDGAFNRPLAGVDAKRELAGTPVRGDAVGLPPVIDAPDAEGEAFAPAQAAQAEGISKGSPPAIAAPEGSPDVEGEAVLPKQAAGQGLPVSGAVFEPTSGLGSGPVSGNLAGGASQSAADGPAPALAAETAGAIGVAGKAEPSKAHGQDGTANAFGQLRADEVRSDRAKEALAKVHGVEQTPSGDADNAVFGDAEPGAAQSAQAAAPRNDVTRQPAAATAASPVVSSLVDPDFKAEAAVTEADFVEGEDAAEAGSEGAEGKSGKNDGSGSSAGAGVAVGQNEAEAQSNRRPGVSGAALAFAAAVRNDLVEGSAPDGSAVETLDGLGFQNLPVDAAAGRQAPQAAQQLPQAAQVAPQIAIQIARHTAQGNSRFQIRLDPAELGGVDVELKITSDGIVKAHLTVERSETLDLFLRDQRSLERALDAAGLKVDGDALQFSLKDQGKSSLFAQGGNDGRSDGEGGNGRNSSKVEQSEAQSGSTAGRVYVRGASGALDVHV